MFTNTKQVPWKAIAAFLVLDVLITVGAVASFTFGLTDPITAATGGLVNATMQVNFIMLLVMVGLVMLGVLHLRPSDVGLVRNNLGVAAFFTLAIWLLVQVTQLIIVVFTTGTIALNPDWAERGFTVMLGALIAQLLGNALYEEICYRGFLLKQVYLKLTALAKRPWLQLITALVLSQCFFAVMHIPVRLYEGLSLGEALQSLVFVLGLGLFFSVIYARTNNLFFAVGVHALMNMPATIFGEGGNVFVALFALIIAIFWPGLHSAYSLLTTRNSQPAHRSTVAAQH